ncbi:AzlC family ABC transporter permease [Acinetobacter rudis]|uniref:AzlC family ABC transporter permease n=1 Tax=Acinetobacter rudis TaxID=632955 RepID=A0AAW8JCV1_9GAMM|nr:AzlC family ABC transporter permease [Acinetobacter rudis]MDQ8936678.1 AzlC family ABC transporter permease [Acinetobacter rudis]MDQ8952388.1 AzlC family ABC transporter permease [Acinetobacter rudis]MDQ9018906.1 AzlC family ABC transporter permease [Acinetobacter rudis]
MKIKLSYELVKAISLIAIATALVGISLGSIAASFNLPLWIPLLLALTVLAGAAEFTFIGMIATGTSPIFAALTGILINLRHLPFGLSVSSFLEKNSMRFIATHIMNDESVMFGLSQKSPELQKAAYWACGLAIGILWPIGVMIGFILGKNIPNIEALGIDAAFPAILFALILPLLKNKTTRKRAILGAGFSLLSMPFLPTGLPVLMSLLALLFWKTSI